MNRALSPFLKSLFAALMIVSSIAGAVEAKSAAKLDPARGEAIYSKGDSARNILACVSCHGAAGNSTIALFLLIAAQHEAYLLKQLANFKTGERNNAVMTPIAKALTDEDMKNISAYLNGQSQKPGAAKNKDIVELGKKIYRAGISGKEVPACASCHSPDGAGIPAQFARLAGQYQEYTAAQLINFRSGARKYSPHMSAIAKRLSDDEIQAVADKKTGLK